MLSDNPLVTIIIPFVEVDPLLVESIKRIKRLNYQNWELFLVADRPVNLNHSDKVKILVSGPKTIAEKRNLAIKKADKKTELFAFIDSDAYPDENWLSEAVSEFKTRKPKAVGGPNVIPPNASWREKVIDRAVKSPIISGLKTFQYKQANTRRVCSLPTCNLVIKKSALENVGFFNPEFVTGEDMELCERINEVGEIVFSEKVVVFHHRRKFLLPFLKQRFVYGGSVFNKLKKGVKKEKWPLFLAPLFVIYLISGAAVSIILSTYLWFFISLFAVVLICLFEAIRCSKRVQETPFVFLAILTSLPFPGLGSFYGLINNYDTQSIYKRREINKKKGKT